uniref:Uncharacterized protein n=1 Tax=Candidatus Kentrum sp. DK TaxID=2126562 RepID=A0A450SW04_9GAMM|nr:MAG: hypothetical protein BECKDK2373B_GA0170837_107116 [Candidatus Kentron sp. DK]
MRERQPQRGCVKKRYGNDDATPLGLAPWCSTTQGSGYAATEGLCYAAPSGQEESRIESIAFSRFGCGSAALCIPTQSMGTREKTRENETKCRSLVLCGRQHSVGVVSVTGRWRQALASVLIKQNRILDDAAQFSENFLLVLSMAATIKQSGTTANVTPVSLGPLHDLRVPRAFIHDVESWMAFLTAFCC